MRQLPLSDLAMHEVIDIAIDYHFPQCGNAIALQITTRRGMAIVSFYDLADDLVSKLITVFGPPRHGGVPAQHNVMIAAE